MNQKLQRFFVLCAICIGGIQQASAQLLDGELAPDFTLVDYNGETQHLYDYLDQGYTVFVDFSATWCNPCWGFHESNTLKNLYTSHGPLGKPGVANSTTNDVMVLFIEGDPKTCTPQLIGDSVDCSDGNTVIDWYEKSKGNWISGTPYPVIESSITDNDYEITAYTTLFRICPNRHTKLESTIKQIGTDLYYVTATDLYNTLGSCQPAISAVNPALLTYGGDTATCESLNPKIIMQNFGTEPLTTATISASVGGTELGSYTWNGTLQKYEAVEIQIPAATITQTSLVEYKITSPNDQTSDDILNIKVVRNIAQTTEVRIEITTDAYGSETRWYLVTEDLQSAYTAGGPYNNLSAAGTTVQTPVTFNLPAGQTCYYFAVTDDENDGMCCNYGQGGYKVFSNNELVFEGGVFEDEDLRLFYVNTKVGIEETNFKPVVDVFPNPANDFTSVRIFSSLAPAVQVHVYNAIGQMVSTTNYGKLGAGLQTLTIPSSEFPSGLYFFSVQIGDRISTHKITIAH
jgi:hypothetical protein